MLLHEKGARHHWSDPVRRLISAAIIPMWIVTADMPLPGSGLGAVIGMIIGCFAVGGGLMFLIFYSARRGHDEEVHFSTRGGRGEDKSD